MGHLVNLIEFSMQVPNAWTDRMSVLSCCRSARSAKTTHTSSSDKTSKFLYSIHVSVRRFGQLLVFTFSQRCCWQFKFYEIRHCVVGSVVLRRFGSTTIIRNVTRHSVIFQKSRTLSCIGRHTRFFFRWAIPFVYLMLVTNKSNFLCFVDRAYWYKLRQWPTWCTLASFYNTSTTILYMFRALHAHHQEAELYWYSICYRPLNQWSSSAQVERELLRSSQPVHWTATDWPQ